METVLIVDDEKNYPLILSAVLEEEGFETLTANSGKAALEIIESSDIDLILTDMKMPEMDGIELLKRIKKRDPDLPVIVMTAHGTVDKAVDAMQEGAYTYIQKPFDNERMILYVKKAIAMFLVVKENKWLRNAVESQYSFGNIIGKSKVIREVFQTILKVAPTTATVILEGESGTGKELVAKSIHFNSPRREKPFIAVNCSALSENLLESELFGHEKGAFTGAASMRKGRFELADGGTLFIDEIGEITLSLQIKLLRVLQEKTVERVGGVKSIPVNFRLIAATNKKLKEEVSAGRFREDLFYRLNVVRITLPPLRDRQEDINLLISYFIKKYSDEHKSEVPITGIEQAVQRLFFDYKWPGNIRELENVINALNIEGIPDNATLYETLAIVEKRMIERSLKLTDNVQAHAAQLLGIGKSGLNQKIKKYKLDTSVKNINNI